MSEQVQRQQRRQHAERHPAPEQEAATGQQRDARLDEEVSCCLADLDEALAESELTQAQRELEQAREEFAHLAGLFNGDQRPLIAWEARYVHLGLRFGISCCGTPYIF